MQLLYIVLLFCYFDVSLSQGTNESHAIRLSGNFPTYEVIGNVEIAKQQRLYIIWYTAFCGFVILRFVFLLATFNVQKQGNHQLLKFEHSHNLLSFVK